MGLTPVIAVLDLEGVSRDVVGWIGETLRTASTADWLLMAAALAILFWLRATSRSKTRIGPVEVNPLECDSSQAKIRAVTASLRERLADSAFLPAPAVPAGTPQANLVEAVAASPISQGAFIAKLIELLPFPQPVQYTLSGTLLGEEGKRDCGISFWLRPSGDGLPLMRTLEEQGTHYKAVEQAAFEIYAHISNAAVDAFPIWTRWRSPEALSAYKAGCELAAEGAMARAILELHIAAYCEPRNALVRLQLANLYEQQAAADPELQADALHRYLDIAVEWPWLVQARYRASVLAGVLAGSCKTAGAGLLGRVHAQLRSPQVSLNQLTGWLQRLAEAESAAVLQMLRPWYVPLRYIRTRHQFEPSAKERRELKRAVGISRHCLRVRLLGGEDAKWLLRWKLRWIEWVVHHWHRVIGSSTVDWQTHYLSACFDALLLERAGRRNESELRRRTLRRRALRQLNNAIAVAGRQLSRAWVETGDPDLQSLREPVKNDWVSSLRLLPKGRARRVETLVPQGIAEEIRYPARPWPMPATRQRVWLGLTLAALAGAIFSAVSRDTGTAIWPGVFVVLAAVGLWRWRDARREARFPTTQ